MDYSYEFELFPNDKIIIQPYKSLTGVHLIPVCEKLKQNDISAVFLNPKLIISIKHIMIAMNRVLAKKQLLQGKGKFDSVKEFINALSPEKPPKGVEFNFYLKDAHGPGILVLLCSKDRHVDLKDYVTAEAEMFEDIGCYADFELLKKIYSIEDVELTLETDIRGSIYNHICLKNLKFGKSPSEVTA